MVKLPAIVARSDHHNYAALYGRVANIAQGIVPIAGALDLPVKG